MTFYVLLFKNANYQEINYKERALFYDNMNGIITSMLQCKALERQYVWKVKTKAKHH